MANEDSFINEVTEEVRRDRLFATFRKYGWIAITAVVLLVGGAAWNEWQRATAEAEAQARGDAILAVMDAEDPKARAAGLAALGDEGDAGAVVRLLQAGTSSEAGDAAGAIATLDALAADPNAAQLFRDLATLKAATIGAGTIPPADRIARLAPLTAPGAPFRALAVEQTALAQVEAGDTEAALSLLTELVGASDASQGLRRRASQLIVALGGSLDAS